MTQKVKRKRMTKLCKTFTGLVPLMYSLAIARIGTDIVSSGLLKTLGEGIRLRCLEFRLMGVVEIEKRDKHKKSKVEYHYLKGIKDYIKDFLRINKKWKMEYENYCGIKTGRIILTRVYRKYYKKIDYDEDVCSKCGRSYDY